MGAESDSEGDEDTDLHREDPDPAAAQITAPASKSMPATAEELGVESAEMQEVATEVTEDEVDEDMLPVAAIAAPVPIAGPLGRTAGAGAETLGRPAGAVDIAASRDDTAAAASQAAAAGRKVPVTLRAKPAAHTAAARYRPPKGAISWELLIWWMHRRCHMYEELIQ